MIVIIDDYSQSHPLQPHHVMLKPPAVRWPNIYEDELDPAVLIDNTFTEHLVRNSSCALDPTSSKPTHARSTATNRRCYDSQQHAEQM
jgi:hypothetical protein